MSELGTAFPSKCLVMEMKRLEKHPPIRESDLRYWHDLIESTGVVAEEKT